MDIDTWLMSCRVLERRVEQAVLNEIVLQARAAGVQKVYGKYLATPRNEMVRDHYEKLGFQRIGLTDNIAAVTLPGEYWELDVSSFEEVSVPLKIVRHIRPRATVAQPSP
jgi:predicted enzyme involved in methoxymalonyl-ACP biosynthesis